MFGAGGTSCGTWTQLRPAGALKPNESVPAEFGVLLMWVVGYMSGANTDPSYPDVLLGKDLAGLIGWIDNYWRANPLGLSPCGVKSDYRATVWKNIIACRRNGAGEQ